MWKAKGQKKIKSIGLVAALAMSILVAGCVSSKGPGWQNKLAEELPVLGHRNWIVIADSAYPTQSRAGIETVATGTGQIKVVEAVLKAVDNCEHIRATVYLDAEMRYVSEKDAPGINTYRKQLTALLGKRTIRHLPHEEVITKLDKAAKTFNSLILKTNVTLPYTSVFLELDCGYWSPEAEQRLRRAMQEVK